jgi:DNA-binding Xre family transcriptional regulator
MGKLVRFNSKKGKVVKPLKDIIIEALDQDIERLCKALDCTPEQAVKTATDFYNQYPILVEHVRNIEFTVGK